MLGIADGGSVICELFSSEQQQIFMMKLYYTKIDRNKVFA